jgi:hypothetical protein
MDAITAPGREKPPIRFDPLSPEYLADLYPFLTAARRSGLSRSELECFGPSRQILLCNRMSAVGARAGSRGSSLLAVHDGKSAMSKWCQSMN